MKFLETPADAGAWCDQQRRHGHTIGYVPTMGALHDGHLSLVERSIGENDLTCVSIFVNPLQFNNKDDLAAYPDSMAEDLAILDQAGVAMVYTGSLATFFPETRDYDRITTKDPCAAICGLEQVSRPGHLEGVQAIVERLFQTVGESRAYFGEKDFQQTLVVRELARRHGSVEVVVCPTVREPSGLAMSSRNRLLSAAARDKAKTLYQALLAARRAWQQGERDAAALAAIMRVKLADPAITVEYVAVREPDNWTADDPVTLGTGARALVAASIDGVRLIDNLQLGDQ